MTTGRAWPWRLAAREGLATARHGRWTSLLVVLAVAWVCAVPAIVDAVGVTRLVESERAWIDAGAYVFVVTGARTEGTENPVPGPVCDGLVNVQGIDASFALVRTDAAAALEAIPGARTSLYDVTGGVYGFLGLTPPDGPAVVVTTGFTRRTGITTGSFITLERRSGFGVTAATSDLLTAVEADAAVMGEEFDGALLVPAPVPADADACYVRTDAAHVAAVEQALPSWLAHDGAPAIANPRLFQGDFTVDYSTAYEDRALRWAWAGGAAALALVWTMILWFRRSHTAIYATFGMKRDSRIVMEATEWAALAGVGALWGWALGVVGAVAFGARATQALTQVTSGVALTLLTASAAVVLLALRPTGSLLATLKDR